MCFYVICELFQLLYLVALELKKITESSEIFIAEKQYNKENRFAESFPGVVTIIKIIKEFIVKKIENSARCRLIFSFIFV